MQTPPAFLQGEHSVILQGKFQKLTAGLAAGLMMDLSGQRRSTFDHRC